MNKATEEPSLTSTLVGVNILLMGPAGTGKTTSIGTLVDAGVEVFYLGLEPGLESLLGYYTDRKKPIPENLHWHTLQSPKASFGDFLEAAKKVNTMSLETLSKMQDPKRHLHNRFLSLLEVLINFPDDRTGKTYGSVADWGTSRALIIDGMSGLGRASMSLVIGGKPVRSQPDWGIAQDNVEKLILQLTEDCICHFVLLAHVEREPDMVLGGVKIVMSALGKALAPKLSPMFSDIILTVREGNKFSWDTGSSIADVKTRNLEIRSGLPVDFGKIIEKWKSRGGVL